MDTEKIQQKCPHCEYETSVKEFATWEKNGKRGLLGKTPEGFLMILCPNCNQEIKYDTLDNKFLKPEEKTKSTIRFNLIILGVIIIIILILLNKFIF